MKFIDARILFVHTDRNCFDCFTLDGISNIKDVKYINSGLTRSGHTYDPEIGDIVKVRINDDGTAELEGFYSAFRKDDKDCTSYQSGEPLFGGDDRLPGDQRWYGPDGANLALDRGKRARLAGGPLAQSVYFGLEGLIRTICQNYEAFGSGFRILSVNTDGKVSTRLCFSSSDQLISKGINNNENAVSESFEYQIDINADGITLFVGSIDGKTGKRVNNFTATITPEGDVIGTCGEFLQFALYATGALTQKIFDKDKKLIYNKSVAKGSDGVLVKEVMTGNYIREIDGDYYENVTGTKRIMNNKNIQVSNFNDVSSEVNRKSAGLNITDLQTQPLVNPIQK